MGYFLERVLEKQYFDITFLLKIDIYGFRGMVLVHYATDTYMKNMLYINTQVFHNVMISPLALSIYYSTKYFYEDKNI